METHTAERKAMPRGRAAGPVGLAARLRQAALRDLQLTGLAGAVLAVLIVGWVSSPQFLTVDNLLNVARQGAIVALLGLAVTISLIAGVVDFSIGATLALTSVVIGVTTDQSPVVTLALLIGLVVTVSLVKALLIAYLELESLITTLGVALILEGIAFAVSGQQIVPVTNGSWRWLGSAELAGVPASVFLVAVVAGGAFVALRSTVYGRYLYATGGNALAAKIAGVPTRRVKLGALVATTAIAAIAGIVFVGRVAAGDPGVGTAFALDAVVVAVLGGASLFGGRGGVVGLLLAASLIALMFNLFTLLDMPTHWQMIVRGGILVGAISLDALTRR